MTLPIWFIDNFYTQTQKSVIETSINIESPYKVATLFTSPDVVCDIEDGITVTIDDGCILNFIDI